MPDLRRVRIAYFNRTTGVTNDVADFETERDLSEYESDEIGVLEVGEDFDPLTHWIDPSTHEVAAYSAEGAERRRNFTNPGGFRWEPSDERWVDERPIDVVREKLLDSLKAKRDALLEGGFTWDGSRFDSDTAISQPRILGLFTSAMAGIIPPEGQPWRLQNNTWRVLSASDAQQVFGALQVHMAGLFAAFEAHEAVVLASEDADFLRNYDINSGWPAT